jgi:hypothetical protein
MTRGGNLAVGTASLRSRLGKLLQTQSTLLTRARKRAVFGRFPQPFSDADALKADGAAATHNSPSTAMTKAVLLPRCFLRLTAAVVI